MGLLYYIIYRAFGSYHDSWARFPTMMCFLAPFSLIMFVSHKLNPNPFEIFHSATQGLGIYILPIAIALLHYALYTREKATKRLVIKYTNKYKFIEDYPITSVWLFIMSPFILIFAITIILP